LKPQTAGPGALDKWPDLGADAGPDPPPAMVWGRVPAVPMDHCQILPGCGVMPGSGERREDMGIMRSGASATLAACAAALAIG